MSLIRRKPTAPTFLTTKEVAARLRCHPSSVQHGGLGTDRLTRIAVSKTKTLFVEAEVEELIRRAREPRRKRAA